MSRRTLHCSPSDSTPSAACAEDDSPAKTFSDYKSGDTQPRVSQLHCYREATIAYGNVRFTLDNILIIQNIIKCELNLLFKIHHWHQNCKNWFSIRLQAHSAKFTVQACELLMSSSSMISNKQIHGNSERTSFAAWNSFRSIGRSHLNCIFMLPCCLLLPYTAALIHTTYSRSPHACHYITPPLPTGSRRSLLAKGSFNG